MVQRIITMDDPLHPGMYVNGPKDVVEAWAAARRAQAVSAREEEAGTAARVLADTADERLPPVDPTVRPDNNPKSAFGVVKAPMALVPPCAVAHIAHAFADGAAKYGPYNWRLNKVSAMVYLNAALRHIAAFIDGEGEAEDSGVHHLGHAGACLAIVLDAEEGGNLLDDRPELGSVSKLLKRIQKKLEARAAKTTPKEP